MDNYRKINMEKWARREHYRYYTEKLKIEFNMTASMDVTKVLAFCHKYGYKFYPTMICLVTMVLNKMENFRMFRDENGDLCAWDKIVPNYTIFHEDDKTFSDCWSEYSEDFETFYHNITEDMQTFKDKKGIKVKDNQPPNFYCISCSPWTSFTSFNSRVANGEPQFFPIITIGKYEKGPDRTLAPVSIIVSHAVCDGYHAGMFYENLQDEIKRLQ